jgi:hypothetical protein
MKKLTISFMFCIAALMQTYAQYPVAPGTKWEYLQLFEPQYIGLSGFTDSISKDTLINNIIYQQVIRNGNLRTWMDGGFPGIAQDVSGKYYFRLQGMQVKVLDSIKGASNNESILYDFSLKRGDTLKFVPKNLIDLTKKQSAYDYAHYCKTNACPPVCVVDTVLPFKKVPGEYTFKELPRVFWKKNIGTTYSKTVLIVLDIYGQEYTLKRLTSNGKILYDYDPLMSIADSPGTHLSLYPNPCTAILNITTADLPADILLYDIKGQVLLKKTLHQTEDKIDSSWLEPGVYFLNVTSRGKYIGNYKIVKW